MISEVNLSVQNCINLDDRGEIFMKQSVNKCR